MATTAELHNLGEAAAIHIRLQEKTKDSGNEDGVRHGHNVPVMLAVVSNKSLEYPEEERMTTPISHNHPILLCRPEKVKSISQLLSLTKPDASCSRLHHHVPMYDHTYQDPDNVTRSTVLACDIDEIGESLANDLILGYDVEVESLRRAVEGYDHTDIHRDFNEYNTLKRGRSAYRNNVSPYEADLPISEHTHRRSQHGRRAQSLPPVYDITLMSYRYDPFHGEITDKLEHKAALIEDFRHTSELHMLQPGPTNLPFKTHGSGEGTFSRKDIFIES